MHIYRLNLSGEKKSEDMKDNDDDYMILVYSMQHSGQQQQQGAT